MSGGCSFIPGVPTDQARPRLVALAIWGFAHAVIYEAFELAVPVLLGTGVIPEQFVQFGGGDLFSLPGTIALGFIHPIAVVLGLVFALGFSA